MCFITQASATLLFAQEDAEANKSAKERNEAEAKNPLGIESFLNARHSQNKTDNTKSTEAETKKYELREVTLSNGRKVKVQDQPYDERVIISPDDYKVVNFAQGQGTQYSTYNKYVIRHKKYTQVDYVVRVAWDWHWMIFDSQEYLLNKKTGDKYMLQSHLIDLPLDKAVWFHGIKGQTVVITSIYPPLDKDVTEVDIVDEGSDVIFPSANIMTDSPHDRNLKVYDSIDDLPYHVVKEDGGRVIKLDEDFIIPKNDSKLYR
ncbi:MAG: hypothetical protein SNH55_08805 [Rikenellaceae bacterium]